jgi:hypothetical protein
MQDGHPMIAEVHQEDLWKPVYVVIPQAEEAKWMMGMMHKNLPAFLYYILSDAGFTEEFLQDLLCKTCEASLVAEITTCKWDRSTRTLTTRADKKLEKAVKAFEGAAWFKDEFGILKRGGNDLLRLPKEARFNLDGIASVKTIHDRHVNNITKKGEMILTKKDNKGGIDLSNDTDGDSASQKISSSSSNSDDDEFSKRSCSDASSGSDGEESAASGE